MSEDTSKQLEKGSKDSISFPYTRNNNFSASKSGGLGARFRFQPVRSDVLMRELLKEENSPKQEISATKKSEPKICDEDETLTNILDTTLIENDSACETNDIMPGFAWLDKTPTNIPIKIENESPVDIVSKILFKEESAKKDQTYEGLSDYLFKTPSFKNYKILTTTVNQSNIPKYSTPNSNDSIISSSNPQLLSVKKKIHEITPKRETITPKPQITDLILREKNLNIEPIKKEIKIEHKPEKQPIVIVKKPEIKEEVKVVQNKPIVLNATPITPEFKTLKIKGKSYVMINKLGEGGSGQVYRCLDQDTLQDRAVKVVNLAVDAHTAASYKNEVKMLKDLQGSERVIKMYDYEQQNQNLFVVMEKGDVDFSTFLRNITTETQTQRHIIICYWIEMLKCVNEIHKKGIIHSDLKPSNFLLVGGRLKLIDFGISSKISGDMTSVIKNEQVGTFNYISPEALLDSRECPTDGKPRIRINYKSDVWSLGCILYQMVYKKTPFHNYNTWMTKAMAIIDRNHRIDYPASEHIPPQLIEMIKKSLTYDMKNRPSVEELLNMYYTGNY